MDHCLKKIERFELYEANPLQLVPKAHPAGIQFFHGAAAFWTGPGCGPGNHPAAPAAGAVTQDVNITPQGAGVRFPHHHVHHSFTVKAGHGLGDDEPTGVLTAGDLGLIAALITAAFNSRPMALFPLKMFLAI